jgi:hypothetical protein
MQRPAALTNQQVMLFCSPSQQTKHTQGFKK